MMSSSAQSDSKPGVDGAGADATSGHTWPRWVRLVSILVMVVCAILLIRLLPMDRIIRQLASTIDELGVWGPVAYAVFYIIAALLFVPGSAITLASGLLFGLLGGTAVVSVASTTAAALAFLIARYLARGSVERWAARSPRFTALDKAIGEGGWKVIALLRLSPAVPYSLGNYLFGLTRVRFWPYVLTSWLFMLPGTFMYVYLGYISLAGLSAVGGETARESRGPAQWALLIVGLLATIAVTIYVTRLARRAMRQHMKETTDEAATASHDASPSSSPSVRPLSAVIAATIALALVVTTIFAYRSPDAVSRLFGPPTASREESAK
ncbi:MAG: TVP38/TMEM64 family protein [Phycisphaeraceae bacterium]